MIKPELFDVVELLVNLPENHLYLGSKGAIVDCYGDGNYEVEFTNIAIPFRLCIKLGNREQG